MSLDHALALLIAVYIIFQFNFDENSHTIHLIYFILHNDRRFLSNSIRILIKDQYISFYSQDDEKQSTSSNSISNRPIPDIESQSLFPSETVRNRIRSLDQDDSSDPAEIKQCLFKNSIDSNSNIPLIGMSHFYYRSLPTFPFN